MYLTKDELVYAPLLEKERTSSHSKVRTGAIAQLRTYDEPSGQFRFNSYAGPEEIFIEVLQRSEVGDAPVATLKAVAVPRSFCPDIVPESYADSFMLDLVHVHPYFRQLGWGRELLRQALLICSSQGKALLSPHTCNSACMILLRSFALSRIEETGFFVRKTSGYVYEGLLCDADDEGDSSVSLSSPLPWVLGVPVSCETVKNFFFIFHPEVSQNGI